jgi:hypothetical protein
MLFNVIRPDASCCDCCRSASGGYLLEDSQRVRKVFCLSCLTALLRACPASLRSVGGTS